MSVSSIQGQKYQTAEGQNIYLPVFGLLLRNNGKASKIQRLHIESSTPIQVSREVAADIHALFQRCQYPQTNTSENQKDLTAKIQSLFDSFNASS